MTIRTAAGTKRLYYGMTLGRFPRCIAATTGLFLLDWKRYLDTTIRLPAAQSIPTPAFRAGDFSAAIAAAGNENLGTDPLGRTILAAMICDPNTRSTTPNGQNLY